MVSTTTTDHFQHQHQHQHLSSSSSSSPMAKQFFQGKSSSCQFAAGAFVSLLLLWSIYSLVIPIPTSPNSNFLQNHVLVDKQIPVATDFVSSKQPEECDSAAVSSAKTSRREESLEETFYDERDMSYAIDKPVKNWDDKRKNWLKQHPSFLTSTTDRVLLVTGSQPTPCKNPIGDHLLLRFFKNKVDYCRIHGYDIFYNNVLLHPKMFTFWAKLPVIKASMLAHPETEWIWWVDSDALFTDMEFKLPLDRYVNHNLVVHGWDHLVHDAKSWTSLNAGVFLIRNCQWSMDFMDVWSSMGPQSPEYDQWGQIQSSLFKDKLFPESDDQAALVYLILKQKEKWADKIYLESEYYFEGYWVEIIGTLDNATEKYVEIERGVRRLRRRHAECVDKYYGELRGQVLKENRIGYGLGSLSRPFITHFTGCQPCSGKHNTIYSGESCWDGMQKALTFADNQVLRNFGFVHEDLLDSSSVSPLPFDYPAV